MIQKIILWLLSFFDNFFKVRDRYESYIDTANLIPYKFIRNVDEGGYKKYNNVTFNQTAGTAVSTNGVFKVTNCNFITFKIGGL